MSRPSIVRRSTTSPSADAMREVDAGPERLVQAVLRPGLRQRLELAVGRRPPDVVEVALDGPQLGDVEREQPFPAERLQGVGVEAAQRDPGDVVGIGRRPAERRREPAERPAVDDGVGQHGPGHSVQHLGARRWVEAVARDRGGLQGAETQPVRQRLQLAGLRVGHSRQPAHFHHARFGPVPSLSGLDGAASTVEGAIGHPGGVLHDGVGDGGEQPVELLSARVPVQEVDAADRAGAQRGPLELGGPHDRGLERRSPAAQLQADRLHRASTVVVATLGPRHRPADRGPGCPLPCSCASRPALRVRQGGRRRARRGTARPRLGPGLLRRDGPHPGRSGPRRDRRGRPHRLPGHPRPPSRHAAPQGARRHPGRPRRPDPSCGPRRPRDRADRPRRLEPLPLRAGTLGGADRHRRAHPRPGGRQEPRPRRHRHRPPTSTARCWRSCGPTGALSDATRRQLARAAFAHTAAYDAAIVGWLDAMDPPPDGLPPTLHLALERAQELRYGENPHQHGARYRAMAAPPAAGRRGGTAPSSTAARSSPTSTSTTPRRRGGWCTPWATGPRPSSSSTPTPAAAAVADDLETAYANAHAADPVSAFGGIVAVNRPARARRSPPRWRRCSPRSWWHRATNRPRSRR